ncbi:MAG: substrate-binding periplasmic protein [Acidimicrobiia bacterium]
MTEFAAEARQALQDLVARYGPGLAEEPRRVQGLLRDVAGAHRREISALVAAAEEGVGATLAAASDSLGPATADRLARRLQADRALTQDAARWAVESWALALGVGIGAEPQPPPPRDAPLPAHPGPLGDPAPGDTPQVHTEPILVPEPVTPPPDQMPQPPDSRDHLPRPPDRQEVQPQRSRRGVVVAVAGAAVLGVVGLVAALGGGSGDVSASSTAPPTTRSPQTTTLQTTSSTRPPSTVGTTTTPTVTITPTVTGLPGVFIEVSSFTAFDIIDRGSISIGVHNLDVAPFKTGEGQDLFGFEIDLARAIVARLFGDIEIDWVPVSAAERFTALDDGIIDMLVRNTTHTTSRDDLALWSSPYFLEGPGFLVRRDGPVLSAAGGPEVALASLDGSLIGVTAGTTTELSLLDTLDAAGVRAEVVAYETLSPLSVAAGEVDAYATSFMGAHVAAAADPSLEALLIDFEEPIAVAVWSGDEEFRDEVDQAVVSTVLDGTVDLLYVAYIGGNIPWTDAELLEFPPINR